MNNKPKKITFVSIFAYPLFNPKCDLTFGGAEVQISLISRELARDKVFDVSVVVADTGQEDTEIHDGVKVIKSYKRGRSFLNLLKAPFQLYKTLAKINPDVVVCRAAGIEVGITGFYAKINRKKFVYSIAHMDDLQAKSGKGFRGILYKIGFKMADIYVAQSDNQKELLKTKKEVVVIKNSLSNNSHSELDSESSVNSILWIGRSVDFKRPEIFIELAESLPEKKFTMVLQKTDVKMWEELKNKAGKLSNLEFIEKIPFNEIKKVFKKTSIFVNTSVEEGFPNTFIQSAMNGTPIVSLKVNPDNFLDEYNCGMACGDNFEKMKEGVVKLLSDKEYCQRLSENSKNYFNENHNIKNNILEWKRILKK